ncbi:site-specific integrase [Mesorhizobium sp. NZP2077]|uniref:site-specific integrase n=1 Tax=Mesorhizobium sp. NZP2077 TaxID=2483404 RepID=UPI001557C862|nr:site-specific integrase [Mesorhizobium sp. NZP2077]QKC85776.1 integrase [Mesorhizobium sp. NZP2077]QKD19415.1 site-specific integrase [Mesorhizobium sp. NZP2077]
MMFVEHHTNAGSLVPVRANHKALPGILSVNVQRLVSNSLADNSKRAYAMDIAHFEGTGRKLPATPATIAEYLAEGTATYAVATLQRRLASISKAHRAIGADDPTKSELVCAALRGVRRTLGVKQRQAKALLRDDLFAVLDRLGDRTKDVRDCALLLLGWACAMRRSELVALDVSDVELTSQGALVTVRRSKTDQEGAGREIAVPFGRTRHCPIAALKRWLEVAGIMEGAIWRGMDKHGNILPERLSGEAVSDVVKVRVSDAGYDPSAFSAHSLRSGFATSAAMAGATSYKIRQVTGHRSEAGLAPYLRAVDLFDDTAAARVL